MCMQHWGVYMGIGDATLTLRKINHQKMSSLTHKHKDGGGEVQSNSSTCPLELSFLCAIMKTAFGWAFVWLLFLICPFMTL